MAAIKLYYDNRTTKKDGRSPLKLKLFHQNKARYIPLNLSFTVQEWDEKGAKVKPRYKNSGRTNADISKKLSTASQILVANEYRIKELDIDDLKEIIAEGLFGKDTSKLNSREYLFSYTQSIVDELIKAKRVGSASSYRCTLKSFQSYLNNNDIPLMKITHKFLVDYEVDCLNRGLKVNSIGVYLRTLRAIINRAIDEEIIPQNQYPFRKFRIKTEKTVKRAISKEEMSKILNTEVDKKLRLWDSKNYFEFMFNMRGMNFIDLAYMKKENIQRDRLEYRRIKTGKLYNIKLTEKATQILNHYIKGRKLKNGDLIFPILKENYIGDIEKERLYIQDRRKKFNADLKRLAEMNDIDVNITSYVTRHTWASLAKFSGVAPAIIGESLGHSDLKTTETYLANFDRNILDEANEKILDI